MNIDIDLDCFGNPVLDSTYMKVTSEIVKSHIFNIRESRNSIPLVHINKKNYNTFVTKQIPQMAKGFYLLYRVDSPVTNQIQFGYIGSSDYNLRARISKFCRNVLDLNTSGDRNYAYCNDFVNKFGRNFENTFASYFVIPKKYKSFFDELSIRKIEGSLIKQAKREYGSVIVNKIDNPTVAKMSEKKKALRKDFIATLPEELFA
jgi:hypothetical protein